MFVPLTIGGGIKDTSDPDGTFHPALEVASEYFRSGADKVSIGSDAVKIAQDYLASNVKTGTSSIEQISRVYGAQAVVISVDPTRVYVNSPSDVKVVGLGESDCRRRVLDPPFSGSSAPSKPTDPGPTAKSIVGTSAPSMVAGTERELHVGVSVNSIRILFNSTFSSQRSGRLRAGSGL